MSDKWIEKLANEIEELIIHYTSVSIISDNVEIFPPRIGSIKALIALYAPSTDGLQAEIDGLKALMHKANCECLDNMSNTDTAIADLVKAVDKLIAPIDDIETNDCWMSDTTKELCFYAPLSIDDFDTLKSTLAAYIKAEKGAE